MNFFCFEVVVERPNLVEVDLEVDLEVETWRMQEPLTKKIKK